MSQLIEAVRALIAANNADSRVYMLTAAQEAAWSRVQSELAAAEAQPALADITAMLNRFASACRYGTDHERITTGKAIEALFAAPVAAAQPESPQPVAVPQEPITLADVLDALNTFNSPKPSEDDGPWEAGHFIRVDHLPAFLTVCYAAWYAAALAAPAAPAPVEVPQEWQQIETIRYWLNAYSTPASGPHFMGHGMVVQLLREYLAMREGSAAPAPQPLSSAQIMNLMPDHIPASYDGELLEFARAVITEFCRVNGIKGAA